MSIFEYWALLAGGLITVICFLWYALPYLIRKRGERLLRHRCRKMRAIILTFDDGPSVQLTPRILDVLDEHEAKATFFMLGDRLLAAKSTALKVRERGHEIASHSQKHLNAWKTWPWMVAQDLYRGFQAMKGITDDDRFFRPPNGKLTLATLVQIWFGKKYLAWWTIDSTDTHTCRQSVEQIIANVREDGGGVILMHDHSRDQLPAMPWPGSRTCRPL